MRSSSVLRDRQFACRPRCDSAEARSARRASTLKIYPGAPHGIPSTLKDQPEGEQTPLLAYAQACLPDHLLAQRVLKLAFSRQFRAVVGVTPRAYRRLASGQRERVAPGRSDARRA
jgi:hypothetical protein